MRNIQNLHPDFRSKIAQIDKLIRNDAPRYVAAAAQRMTDANFSAQGFITAGTARPAWKKRKQETTRSSGKKILHSTGILQNSVKAQPAQKQIRVGVDLGKVPYAKVHNTGGHIIQNIRAHHRQHWKSGRRYQVRPFSRSVYFPRRQYLGYSPDIIKSAEKDIKAHFDNIFK